MMGIKECTCCEKALGVVWKCGITKLISPCMLTNWNFNKNFKNGFVFVCGCGVKMEEYMWMIVVESLPWIP